MAHRPNDDTVFAEFDGTGVVFSIAQQRLYRLNETATGIWSSLCDHNATATSAARQLAVQSGIELGVAADYVDACLRQWTDLGLLGPSISSGRKLRPCTTRVATSCPWPPDDIFLTGGATFGVTYPDESIAAAVRGVLGHLRVVDAVIPDHCFAIRTAGRSYRLLVPGWTGPLLPDAAAVGVELKAALLEEVLRTRPAAMAIHAAALASPQGVVLLVGSSGSGKTTLAALLNAKGWPAIADDAAIVDSDTSMIGGLALAYAVKPGSWPVLSDDYPEMQDLEMYLRPDGRAVKYAVPKTVARSPVRAPVVSVLFPHYRKGAALDLRRIEKVEALARILSEARNSAEWLSLEGFKTLAGVITRAAVLEVEYDNAQKAADALLPHYENRDRVAGPTQKTHDASS